MKPRSSAIAFVGISSLLVTACGNGGASASPDEADAEEVHSGGVLEVAASSDISCLDGQQARGHELIVATQIIEPLTVQHAETGEIHPRLAESWEVNDDASEFTFYLRDDVSFHNGQPLIAQNVKDNFEGILDLGVRSGLGQTYLAGLEEIEVVDDHTVRVAFDGPNAQFLQASSTTSLGLYADETLEVDPETRCQGDVIGTGPFQFESYTGNTTVELSRYDDYDWAPSDVHEHEGPALLDGWRYTVMPESSVRHGSLQSGQIHVNPGVAVQDRDALEAQDFPIYIRSTPGAPNNLWYNVEEGHLTDPLVRQAITFAIDNEELASVRFEEQEGATNTLSQATPGYQAQEDLLAYDPDRSAELLEEAGWTVGDDGIRVNDQGEPLTIEITDYYQHGYEELIQEQLVAAGFDAHLHTVTFAERSAILENGEYEIMTGSLTRSDADIIRTIHHFEQQNTNQRSEHIELDEDLQASLAINDEAERAELLNGELSRALLEGGYTTPLVENVGLVATAPEVHGFQFDAMNRQVYYEVWIEE